MHNEVELINQDLLENLDKRENPEGKKRLETSIESDYFKTKTPVNESRGELLEEFITPEINTEELKNGDGKVTTNF